MDCESCREALSARMDGEADQDDGHLVDRHLITCTECRAWQARAGRITRVVRVRPAMATPDLTAAILAAAAKETPARAAAGDDAWRWLLGLVAFVQLVLGLAELLGVAHTGHGAVGESEHIFDESTAWNIALGIGFAVAAVWPRLAGGLLPTLGVFLAVLTGVSVVGLIERSAELSRVSSHVIVLLGMALLVMVHRHYVREPGDGQRQTRGFPAMPGQAEPMPDVRMDGPSSPGRGLRPAGRHAA